MGKIVYSSSAKKVPLGQIRDRKVGTGITALLRLLKIKNKKGGLILSCYDRIANCNAIWIHRVYGQGIACKYPRSHA